MNKNKIRIEISNLKSEAVYSLNNKYRYRLTKTWNELLPKATFIGLNPSVATELIMDKTVMNVMNYLIDNENKYGGVHIVNLFAYRSKDPTKLTLREEEYEIDNFKFLEDAVMESPLIIAGWGRDAENKQKRAVRKVRLILEGHLNVKCFMDSDNVVNRHPGSSFSNKWVLVDYL